MKTLQNQTQIDLSYPRHIHFIGIGGAGMSGLAQIVLKLGHEVTGSDLDHTSINIDRIKKLGGRVDDKHSPENINGAEIVIYSSCIKDENPEMLQARAKGLPVVPRACLLAELMKDKKSIAVSGSHGKTTTTSLISMIFSKAGLAPSIVIGGEVDDFGGSACLGQGNYFIAEADESDGSLLCLNQTHSVITNIEPEHMDYYENMEQVMRTYKQFVVNGSPDGYFIGCIDDENIASLVKTTDKNFTGYGFGPKADVSAANIRLNKLGSEFNLIYKGRDLGLIKLRIPGEHNILNTLAACAVSLVSGIGFKDITEALFSYKGVRRRFEIKLKMPGIMVIDDYAHHPTEIKVTIAAARNGFKGRLIGIFQPHRYTRTKLLDKDFSLCFKGVDQLILTDVYSAGEPVLEGVSGRNIFDGVKARGQKDTVYFSDKEDIIPHIMNIVKSSDRILVMGAGDITKIADKLAEELGSFPAPHKQDYII